MLVADLWDPRIRGVRCSPPRRWPGPRRGLTFAFPLQIGAIAVGSLDLYRVTPGLLTAAELSAALLVADAALWALLDLRTPRPDTGPDHTGDTGDHRDGAGAGGGEGWLRVLHRDHAVVYQATGVVLGS